jgi:glucan 1,3-beta-glucosidase
VCQSDSYSDYTFPFYQNWFFWTWKIGNSTVTGVVESPAWSYQLGLQQGWMPTDPRTAAGTCGNTSPWQGPLQPYQTGGAGAGNIPASVTSSLAWPPATISNGGAITSLPSYTPTASLITLSPPTFSPSVTVSLGNGWANPSDTTKMMTNIATCSYLDPWVGPTAAPPSPLCSSPSKKGRSRVEGREPAITPKPTPSR